MANGHGGARSGAGRKKGQRSKATERAKATLADLAKRHTDEAIATILDVMKNGDTDNARLAAASAMLDRGYGRPVQANVEFTPEDAPAPFDGFLVEDAKPDQG